MALQRGQAIRHRKWKFCEASDNPSEKKHSYSNKIKGTKITEKHLAIISSISILCGHAPRGREWKGLNRPKRGGPTVGRTKQGLQTR
jgi:hypothetical protein